MSTLTCTSTINSYGNELSYLKQEFVVSNDILSGSMTDTSSIGSNEGGSAFGYDSWTGNIEDYYDVSGWEGSNDSYELKALLNLFPKISINITGNTRATGKTCILFPDKLSMGQDNSYLYRYSVFALYSFDSVEKLPYVGQLYVLCNDENIPIEAHFNIDRNTNYDFWCAGIVDSGEEV